MLGDIETQGASHLGAPFLKEAAVLLAIGVAIPPLARRFRVSPVVGFLIAGVVLGPAALGVFPNAAVVRPIAELGVIFLLFAIGLELSFERLKALRRLIFGLGGAQMLATTGAAAIIALAWGRTGGAALVLALCVAFSSTAIAMQLLSERRETAAPHGRAAFAVLLLQDLAVAPALVLLGALAHGVVGPLELSWTVAGALGRALAAVALIVVIGRFVLRRVCRLVAQEGGPELRVGFTALLVLATAWSTWAAGLSAPLGAFLAGLLIAETPLRAQAEADLEPFRGLLLGVFFVGVGLTLSPASFLAAPGFVIAAALGLAMLKAAIVFAAAWGFGRPPAEAARVAGLLAGAGEFGFVVVAAAGLSGLLDASTAAFIALVIAVSMMATPLFDVAGRRLARRLEEETGAGPAASAASGAPDCVIIVGYGRVGRVVARVLESQSAPWAAIDERPAAGEPRVLVGDAGRTDTLERAGLARASAVVLTMEDADIALRVARAARLRRSDIAIVARACDEAARKRLGAHDLESVVAESFAPGPQLARGALAALGAPDQTVRALIEDAGLEAAGLEAAGLEAGADLENSVENRANHDSG